MARKPSTSDLDAVKDSVHVFARFRPPNAMERVAAAEGRSTTCSNISADGKSVVIKTGGDDGELAFHFDQVMSDCSQSDVYAAVGAPLIASTFAGFNTTLFAYGQTGSGKTHTMYGPDNPSADDVGVAPRANHHLFSLIAADTSGSQFLIQCSYIEIYREHLRDLLQVCAAQRRGRARR